MDEAARLLAVAAALAVTGGAVWLRRRVRTRLRRVPPALGPFPKILLFGSETCASCRPVVEALKEAAVTYDLYTWEEHPSLFASLPVDEVPRVLAVDPSGIVRHDFVGELGAWHLSVLRRFS